MQRWRSTRWFATALVVVVVVGQGLTFGCARTHELEVYTGRRRTTVRVGVIPLPSDICAPGHAKWADRVRPPANAERWVYSAREGLAPWDIAVSCGCPVDVVALIWNAEVVPSEREVLLAEYHRDLDALMTDFTWDRFRELTNGWECRLRDSEGR